MALSRRLVCLQKFNVNFSSINPKDRPSLPNKQYFRYLRGSRFGREITREETKYKNLLKSLRDSAQKSSNSPANVISSVQENEISQDETFVKSTELDFITLEQLSQRFENKITPLKKLPYTKQLERKYNKSLGVLRLFGQKLESLQVPISLGTDKLPCPMELTVPSPLTEAYRNHDEFSIGTGLDGNLKTVGFYPGSIVDNTNMICVGPHDLVIIKNSHKAFVKDFQSYIRQSSLPAYVSFDGKGNWRSITIRSNIASELMAIVAFHPQSLSKNELENEKENLRQYFCQSDRSYNLKSLYFQECTQLRSSVDQGPFELLLGEPCVVEEFSGMHMQLSPGSFFLSNTSVTEVMYQSLLKLCRVGNSTTVIDIFCGAGPLSMMLSSHVKQCIGIDSCVQSIKNARMNAAINNLHNVEFIHGSPDNLIADILDRDYYDDLVVVINASKTELSKISLRSLRACKYLKKIVYITSNPKTATENFVKLCKLKGSDNYLGKAFIPILGVPVDLCPQTEHYGLVVMFQRL